MSIASRNIWLETDLEPDDVAAMCIFKNRGYRFSHVLVGEGDSTVKCDRIIKYLKLLETKEENLSSSVIIKGFDSNRKFKKDGLEFIEVTKMNVNVQPIWCPRPLAASQVESALAKALETKSEKELLSEYQRSYSLDPVNDDVSDDGDHNDLEATYPETNANAANSADTNVAYVNQDYVNQDYNLQTKVQTNNIKDAENNYIEELENYINLNKDRPTMIILKPFRELMKHYYYCHDANQSQKLEKLEKLLSQVTLWIYGSFNFRCILDSYSNVQVEKVLKTFKNVYIYESFLATGEQNNINSVTMPKFFATYNLEMQKSEYVQNLHRLIFNWNQCILETLLSKNDESKSSNSDDSSRKRANKIIASIREHANFSMVAADIGLAAVFEDFGLFTPVDLSFDPNTYYSLIKSNPLSSIFVIKNIPWTDLEKKINESFP